MKRLDRWRLRVERTGDMNVEATIYASEKIKIESEALEQLLNATRLPSVWKVLATPDIHIGYGVPIGCVAAVESVVVPAAVGYDVNCGMRVMTTGLKVNQIDVKQVADSIRRDIPLGEGKDNVRVSFKDLEAVLARGVKALSDIAGGEGRVWQARSPEDEIRDIERIEDNGSMAGDPKALSDRALERGRSQLATLGGGNHFIEIQVVDRVLDEKLARRFGLEKDGITVMVHSGSRGLGHQVGTDYMKLARKYTTDKLHSWDLNYLPVDSPEGQNYIKAMYCAANFAFANRQLMGALVRHEFRHIFGNIPMPIIYDVPHNMAKHETHFGREVWVHRKGATRAFGPSRMQGTEFADCGQPVLIPGSMGTASYLLVGHDSPQAAQALFSVNHGAGRVMSRTAARGVSRQGKVVREAAISDERFRESMDEVYLIAEDRRAVKEEAPDAYKDIDDVMETVLEAGLARGVARLRPLAVLKG